MDTSAMRVDTGVQESTLQDRARKHGAKIGVALLIGLLLLVEVYPLLWLLLSSIKAPAEFNVNPIYALPEGFHWQNYVDAWTDGMSITSGIVCSRRCLRSSSRWPWAWRPHSASRS